MRRLRDDLGRPVDMVIPSRRDVQVLWLVLHGIDSASQIAHRLGVSRSSAKTYLRNLCRELRLPKSALPRWVLERPKVLEGKAVPFALHPDGCGCIEPFCSAVQPARSLAATFRT